MSKRKHDGASSSADRREFANPYPPYSEQLATSIIQNGKLTDSFCKTLNQTIVRLVGQMESGLRRDCDESISLLYLHLYTLTQTQEYLSKCYEYVKRPLRHLKGRRVTFMCGDAGPLVVGCLLHHKTGNQSEAQQCIDKLQAIVQSIKDPNLPDELLYGRVGYLYALLFIQKHLGEEHIDPDIIEKVCRCIIDSGQRLARKEKSESPLMFEWHEKKYLGAAHGMAGILAVLLQVKSPVVTESLHSLIKPTVDFILHLRFPSGNFPSSLGNQSDKLIHWCHGAPGVIHMLLQAHKVFGESKYLSAAADCGTVIWERGILRKGYGLCHGTAGNAYAFLALYQATKEEQYLYKACKFAEWCMDYGKHGCRIADRPYSLMEEFDCNISPINSYGAKGFCLFPNSTRIMNNACFQTSEWLVPFTFCLTCYTQVMQDILVCMSPEEDVTAVQAQGRRSVGQISFEKILRKGLSSLPNVC